MGFARACSSPRVPFSLRVREGPSLPPVVCTAVPQELPVPLSNLMADMPLVALILLRTPHHVPQARQG